MKVVITSPVLESVTRTGKKKYWQAQIVQKEELFCTRTCYWQDTTDGGESVKQYSEPKIAEPTNVGRSNERNNKEQAYFEYEAMITKQKDKGYHEEGIEANIMPLPMLANKWHDKKHTITFPVAVQPKLDGVRMLMKDGVCWSRTGKPIIPEVVQHITCNTNGLILDGELIYEGASFQDTMRAVKKYRPELSSKLTYHVFDIVDDSLPFISRYELLEDFFSAHTLLELPIQIVPTIWLVFEDSLNKYHVEFVEAGYEGTIIRVPNGKYQIGQRSSELLKLKDFDDDEFEIIGVTEGEGRDSGAAIFECITKNGLPFLARPKGTMESRQEAFKNKHQYIGKQLTVRYQGFSEDGIPRFPIGINVREEVQG
jgi:DNA ligase-1